MPLSVFQSDWDVFYGTYAEPAEFAEPALLITTNHPAPGKQITVILEQESAGPTDALYQPLYDNQIKADEMANVVDLNTKVRVPIDWLDDATTNDTLTFGGKSWYIIVRDNVQQLGEAFLTLSEEPV